MTSLPGGAAPATTALNSLGHGADALFGPVANPFSTQSALRRDRADRRRPRPGRQAERDRVDARARLAVLRARDRRRRPQPSPRRLPGAGARHRDPACGDERDDAARTRWGRCASASRRRWRPWRRRSGPTSTGLPGRLDRARRRPSPPRRAGPRPQAGLDAALDTDPRTARGRDARTRSAARSWPSSCKTPGNRACGRTFTGNARPGVRVGTDMDQPRRSAAAAHGRRHQRRAIRSLPRVRPQARGEPASSTRSPG